MTSTAEAVVLCVFFVCIAAVVIVAIWKGY